MDQPGPAGPADAPQPHRIRSTVLITIPAVLALALVIWLVSLWRNQTSEITHTPFVSPYRNTKAGVAYVGDERCITCHAEIVERYRRHPMGQSLAALSDAPVVEKYGRSAQVDFDAGGFHYEVERHGTRLRHRETKRDAKGRILAGREVEIEYVLGSGTRGRSYVMNFDGRLFQSPIAWFAQAGKWDLSPGYQSRNFHFERPLEVDCLFCHTNRVRPVADTHNRYEKPLFQGHAIGCERCHGPGALHVQDQEAGGRQSEQDTSIVNPAKLPEYLRDAVCEQCHLQGTARITRRGREEFDYRPGLPLHDYLAVFVKPPELAGKYRAVSQVEQMVISRCYVESKGKLGCISCHDPHGLPPRNEAGKFYRNACLKCHGPGNKECSLDFAVRQQKNQDQCVACHMARFESADVAHTAVTDHRILRRPDAFVLGPDEPRHSRLPLVPFHQKHLAAGDSLERELGLALVQTALSQNQPQFVPLAMPRLESALSRWPDDVPVLKAKAMILFEQRRPAEALGLFKTILAQSPQHEEALGWAGSLCRQLGSLELAESYWRQAIDVNPYLSDYRLGLARTLFQREHFAEAAKEAQAALALNPMRLDARKWLILSYHRLGDRQKTEAELAIYRAFRPSDFDEVRRLVGGN
jgi:tetratricopeptide repeat protein